MILPDNLSLVNLKKYERMTIPERLKDAVRIGNIRIVKRLIKYKNANYNKLMIIACRSGHTDIVKLILTLGAEIRSISKREIEYIILNGYTEIFMLVIGAEHKCEDYDRYISLATVKGNLEIVKSLLGKGNKVYDFIMAAASYTDHIEIVKLMVENGASCYDYSAILAAKEGHLDIVRLMLDL